MKLQFIYLVETIKIIVAANKIIDKIMSPKFDALF